MSKEKQLEELRRIVLECRKCKLWQYRRNVVFGEGSPYTSVMFIGEAPGEKEDLSGRPFVGSAGKLLTQLINSIGLRREDVYITNVLKCRPPGNRDPEPDEIEACRPYLEKQIEIIQPEIIVTLGRYSTKFILEAAGHSPQPISKVRGIVMRLKLRFLPREVIVLPMYHPAAALYNPRVRKYLEEDFRKLKQCIEHKIALKEPVTLDKFFNTT